MAALLGVVFTRAQGGMAGLCRWLSVRVLVLLLLPLRLALAVIAMVAERTRRMKEDEEQYRRSGRDEVSVSRYGSGSGVAEVQ